LVLALLVYKAGEASFFQMTIPEQYEQERQKLETNRSLDWSTFRKEFFAAGEELMPMTVQTWFDLLLVQSPIVMNQEITVESVIDYIWRNCKRYTDVKILKEWRLYWLQKRVLKCLSKPETSESMVRVVCQHVEDSFAEFPECKDTAMAAGNNTMSGISGEASMLDEIAHRYGMNPMDVLSFPLRRAFSLQRTIRTALIPEYKLLEPASLREIKSQYLNSINNA